MSARIESLRRLASRTGFSRPVVILLMVWTLIMVALPIVRAVASTETFNTFVIISVLVQAVAVLVIVGEQWGWRRTVMTALGAAILTWGLEAIGSATGFPFGDYDYTSSLQPQLAGVPVIIPLAWLMMLPPAWAVAQVVVGHVPRWAFILVSAAAFTAWDLYLDPQMVSWGYWVWDDPRGYFGIPWINYFGWFISAALLSAVLRPIPVPARPLLIIYTITWALEAIGLLVFFGLPGPGLVGLVVMGFFVAVAWRRSILQEEPITRGLNRKHHA